LLVVPGSFIPGINSETNKLAGQIGSYQGSLDPLPLAETYDRLNSFIPSINGSKFSR
jgi:hypothetical protein